jgi:hypothetical protein
MALCDILTGADDVRLLEWTGSNGQALKATLVKAHATAAASLGSKTQKSSIQLSGTVVLTFMKRCPNLPV